ncbi:MAG: sterol desaturase family protein [Legionella longbeachae]|nr:sterol desaturase family protein [Legionella longbeachae]
MIKLINQLVSGTYVNIIPRWKLQSKPIPEAQHSIIIGILAHLGPIFLFCLLTTIYHFDPLITLLSFTVVSILMLIQFLLAEWIAPSVALNISNRQDILSGLVFVFLTGVGVGSIVVSLTWYGSQCLLPKYPIPTWISIWVTVALADFSYYFIHRFFNHSRSARYIFRRFRRSHGMHHSVKALDFLRGNKSSLMDTAVASFQVPTAVIGSLLGLNLTQVLVSYALLMLLQGTHHVNFTFNIGWLRYLFVDNHNHKLHHCPRGHLVNYGAVFSLWDRLFGTFYENWDLSSNYMEKNRIALPIQPKRSVNISSSRSLGPSACPRDPEM